MHISVSVWDFFAFVCYALIFGFIVNWLKATYPDNTTVKGLMFLTS